MILFLIVVAVGAVGVATGGSTIWGLDPILCKCDNPDRFKQVQKINFKVSIASIMYVMYSVGIKYITISVDMK